jgi:hypothetical protein
MSRQPVIPAEAGIHLPFPSWIPACAGMTTGGVACSGWVIPAEAGIHLPAPSWTFGSVEPDRSPAWA